MSREAGAAKLEGLPPAVATQPRLVSWLVQRAEDYRNRDARDEDGDPLDGPDWPEWAEPRERDLRSVVSAVDRLVAAAERLHPSILVNATLYTHSPGWEELRGDLWVLQSEAQHWLHTRGKRRSGPRPDRARRILEGGVAQDLRRFGIRLTRGRAGLLARTLVAVYHAAGIRVEQDSLLPVLQRLVPTAKEAAEAERVAERYFGRRSDR